jgi:two-component system, LytTR family, sensor kinase
MDRRSDTRPPGPSSRSYWTFQLTFWSLVLLPDFFTVGRRPSLLDFLWSLANIGLLVVATHVFHLLTTKRRWLYLPPGGMIARTAAAVVLMAAIYFAGGFPEKLFQGPERNRYFHDPGIIIGYALGALVLSCAWAGCYLALSEAQRRRGLEFQELQARLAAREAQLRNLSAQLNPHFLFNSLNTLRELMIESPERAQLVITKLSILLRYSLQLGSTEFIGLAEELEAIDGYLAVEAARYEERLRVRWEIDGKAGSARVPPMLLQPLVENAVKHGVACKPEGGEVIIRAKTHDGQLFLQVLNSGELKASPISGVGLQNTRERLQLLYGARAHFALEDTRAGHIRASVILPFECRNGAA